MDEKTEELRDIFIDVTDESVVTEKQADDRGSLASGERAAAAEERIGDVLARMHERYEFDSDLDDEALVDVVRAFFEEEEDDDAVADRLGISTEEAFVARTDLHLLREDDEETPFDRGAFRERIDGGAEDADLAEAFDLSESAAARHRRVVETREEIRQVSGRFRDEFEEILTDADLATRMTEEVQQDGLEEATDGSETNVSF